jgi:16S rRNA (cytosine967-C5)-methyltransferase
MFNQVPGSGEAAGLAARRAALQAMRRVFGGGGAALEESLLADPGWNALAARDRAFARLLTATCFRRLGQIDAAVAACLSRPGRRLAAEPMLRLGACELLFLAVPPHAAVMSWVTLAKSQGAAAQAGLVNAVLRRLAREGAAIVAAQDTSLLAQPEWLRQSWSNAYGADIARAIAAAHLVEPPLDLTVKTAPEIWAERLGATLLPNGSLRLPADRSERRIENLPGFAEGAWWVQDAAAAWPVQLFGDPAGNRAIDLCAAPGGKTAQLAARGASVTSVDPSAKRLVRLSENLARLKLSCEIVRADATVWRPREPADLVLLDAPCSATGTIRRRPDIAWTTEPAEIVGLVALQDRLLRAAGEMVRPGGRLIFCTCSLQPEEGPERITAFLASGAPFVRQPIREGEAGIEAAMIDAEGALRTLPSHWPKLGGLDGFYAARLQRI